MKTDTEGGFTALRFFCAPLAGQRRSYSVVHSVKRAQPSLRLSHPKEKPCLSPNSMPPLPWS